MKRNRARRKKVRPQPDALDWLDDALARCQNLETLAALLETYGTGGQGSADPQPEIIVRVSHLLDREARQLGELIRGRQPNARRPSR